MLTLGGKSLRLSDASLHPLYLPPNPRPGSAVQESRKAGEPLPFGQLFEADVASLEELMKPSRMSVSLPISAQLQPTPLLLGLLLATLLSFYITKE